MRIIKASSKTDGGAVEVAPRDVESNKVSEHGYFLGVRDENGKGTFVELTRDEAAEVASQLISRVNAKVWVG